MAWLLSALLTGCATDDDPPNVAEIIAGPVVGHVDGESANFWLRARSDPASLVMRIRVAGSTVAQGAAAVTAAGDGSLHFRATGLAPATTYDYRVLRGRAELASGTFTTAPAATSERARLVFASCINDRKFPKQPAWAALTKHRPDALVLLGDTPYIDTTELAVQRARYRAFWMIPDARPVFSRVPTWATWDDHDFGKNDTDGRLGDKRNSRRAFVEHHAHTSFGTGTEGIYTSFRWGPVEVFLIDTRWWANTGPSPVDPDKKTVLGSQQWNWLKAGLLASDAPFKVLASGMIWNGSVRPFKKDHWLTWKHERDAIWKFIGDNDIPGVVLVGGDIHRSRALKHAAEELAGYPLYEFISSPMANTIIVAANVKHRALLHDAAEQHTFMLMDASPTTLRLTCLNHENQALFAVEVPAAELR